MYESKIKKMKKLILVFVVCLPLIATAGHVKPVKVSFSEWIKENIVYPNQAIKNHEEGIVYVSFTISETGKAENVCIEEGVSTTLNAEALTIFNDMPLQSLYVANEPSKRFIVPIKFILK
jgi:TonB family protein